MQDTLPTGPFTGLAGFVDRSKYSAYQSRSS